MGVARSPLSDENLRDRLRPFLEQHADAEARAHSSTPAQPSPPPPRLIRSDSDSGESDDSSGASTGAESGESGGGGGLRPHIDAFLARCTYWQMASYADAGAMGALDAELREAEARHPSGVANRLFYFAIPPNVFLDTAVRENLEAELTA